MEEPKPQTYSEIEREVAFSSPALASNRFIVAVSSSGVRISFLEAAPDNGPTYLRAAVFLGASDAIELGRILSEIPPPAANDGADDKP